LLKGGVVMIAITEQQEVEEKNIAGDGTLKTRMGQG
jgi:hypothetical protein